MSCGRETALYQLISIKNAQIHTLRDDIKKSIRRPYFSFVINLIIRISSNPEEKFRKFPRVVWTGEVGFVHNTKNIECPKKSHNQKTDIQIQILSDHIKNSNRRTYFSFAINLITKVSSNPEEKIRKFPRVVRTGEGVLLAYKYQKGSNSNFKRSYQKIEP